MKFIKLKALITTAGFFALTATFAQDSTTVPKTDTSKWPKNDTTKMPMHDSTSMSFTSVNNAVASSSKKRPDFNTIAFINDDRTYKKTTKANPAKLPE